MKFYLLAWFEIVGMANPAYHPTTTFVETDSYEACQAEAAEQIPKIVTQYSRNSLLGQITHICIPVNFLGPYTAMRKKCKSHTDTNCLQRLRATERLR